MPADEDTLPLHYVLVPLLFLLIMLPLIGLVPLGNSTEAREAHVVAIMQGSGEWILPRRFGIIPSKPPLFHWLALPGAVLWGKVTPFVVRLPSLLFGAGTLFLTMYLSSCLSRGADTKLNRTTSLLSGIILATSYGFLALANRAMVDMTYVFFVIAALASLLRRWKPEVSPSSFIKSKDINLFFLCSGFAVLGKGPLGLVLPLAIMSVIILASPRPLTSYALFLRPRLGWLYFLMIALSWYVICMYRGGSDFVWRHIIFENLRRFTGGEGVNEEVWWFYIPSFLRTMTPWSIIFLGIVFAKLYRTLSSRSLKGEFSGLPAKIPLIWFIVGFLLFSLSSGKRHSYLLPIYPAVAILVAHHLSEWWVLTSDPVRAKTRMVLSYLAQVSLVILTIGFILVLGVIAFGHQTHLVKNAQVEIAITFLRTIAPWVGVTISLIIALSYGLISARSRTLAAPLAFFGVVATATITGTAIKNNAHDFSAMAGELDALHPLDLPITIVRPQLDGYFDTLLFFLKRQVRVFTSPPSPPPCPALYLVKTEDENPYLELLEVDDPKLKVKELGRFYQKAAVKPAVVLYQCEINSHLES